MKIHFCINHKSLCSFVSLVVKTITIKGKFVPVCCIACVWLLLIAVRMGSTAIAETAADEYQFTAAEQAEIDKFCAKFGTSDAESLEESGRTLLESAVRFEKSLAVLKFLVSKGADVNAKDESDGFTALMWAADVENMEFVQFLVSKGADVNAKSDQEYTPLMLAAVRNEKMEIVKFLIANGADVCAKDKTGEILLHKVVPYQRNLEVIKLLASEMIDANIKKHDGITLLHLVAALGKTDEVNSLVSQGINVNIKDNIGFTPLHWAVLTNENIAPAALLISQGADVNAKEAVHDFTPLHLAALGIGNVEIANLLISKGADVNATGKPLTPLGTVFNTKLPILTGNTPTKLGHTLMIASTNVPPICYHETSAFPFQEFFR